METDIPDRTAPNVHYFEAGTHQIDSMRLKDNDIVYLEGGAFVYAKPQPPEKLKPFGLVNAIEMWWADFTLMAEGVKNVRIAGRGVLCGRKTLEACQRHRLLGIMRSSDVTVEGIVFREGTSWSIHTEEASQVLIDNVKVLGHFANNDGIDVCDSHDVLVRNSFAHNADDSFLVKAFKPVSNVVFENCVAWNDVSTSFGAVCEIAAEAKNIVFRGCTVTHSTFPLWDHDAGGVIGVFRWLYDHGNAWRRRLPARSQSRSAPSGWTVDGCGTSPSGILMFWTAGTSGSPFTDSKKRWWTGFILRTSA